MEYLKNVLYLSVSPKSNMRSCLVLLLFGFIVFAIAVAYIYLNSLCYLIPEDRNAERVLSWFRAGSLTEQEKEALAAYVKWVDPGFIVVAPKRMETIQIERNAITDEDIRFVAEFSNLRELRLRNCPRITDQGMVILEHLPHLKILNVEDTNVTEASVPLIAELKNLEKLYLGRKPLDNDERRRFGIRPLKPGEGNYQGESWIDMPIAFTDKTLELLKDSNIKELRISSPTCITDEGLWFIISMQKLETIDISSDFITQKGVEELIPNLPCAITRISISALSRYGEGDIGQSTVIRLNNKTISLRLMENQVKP